MPNYVSRQTGFSNCLAIALVMLAAFVLRIYGESAETELRYAKPEKLCDLDFDVIKESSGLAVSRIRPNVLWTHNDSGDQPRLYAFDETGKPVCTCKVANASARDWEDMASFQLDNKPYLLVGDVGDNGKKRTKYQLYLIPESLPDPNKAGSDKQTKHALSVERTVLYKYDSGSQDCESIAFDPVSRQVLFVTKNWSLTAEVYVLDWKEVEKESPTSTKIHTAKQIGEINVPGATAMDISPDGLRAVVICYGNAYEYVRAPNETWEKAFSRRSREIKMPERKQGETICYGGDGRTIFLTSEHLPTPLFRVAVSDDGQ